MLTADEILTARHRQLEDAERTATARRKALCEQVDALSVQLVAIRSAKDEIALLRQRFGDAKSEPIDLTQSPEKEN